MRLAQAQPEAAEEAETEAEASEPKSEPERDSKSEPERDSKSEPEPAAPAPESSAGEAEAAGDEEEMAEGDDMAELSKPPAKGKGVVWGVVTDTKFDEGVVDAEITVIGRKERVFANLDGGYRLELPPGTYSVRVRAELYQPSRVDKLQVKAGAITRVNFEITPDEKSVEEVVIEDEADLSSSEGQTLSRKRSAVVGDGVGRAEIARTPDRNAAEAAQRVVGATIVGGRFVYVRGLGERYTNALLNGAPMPSTEPDRNTVALDLFPSLVLDSLTIVKQFTPDMPADFAGGSVRVQTREFPQERLFQITASGAVNTTTTGQKVPTYYGSGTDWLGFDGGRRSFPEGIPNRKLDATGATDQERVVYGHAFNSSMSTARLTAPPSYGLSVVAGDSFKLNKDTKLGAMLALTYGRTFTLRDITVRRYRVAPLPDDTPALLVGDDFSGLQGIDAVRWGAFGSLAVESKKNTTIRLVGLHSQSADDLTSELEGTYEAIPGYYHVNHMEYVSRALNFVQLGGTHRFPKLDDAEIDWHASIATADRDQPDTRDLRYRRDVRDGEEGWRFVSDLSGQHQYIEQSDTTITAGLDMLQPIIKPEAKRFTLKAGGLVTSRRRDFLARRFQLEPSRTPGPLYDALSFCNGAQWNGACPNVLFRQETINPQGLLLDEWTLNFDQYETGLDVYALYAMADAKLMPQLRAVGGVRTEITYQAFAGFDPFDRAGTEQRSNIYQADFLPALSLIYALSSKTNVRLGGSQTLARPQLRELSPALSTSYSGDLSVQGNPELVLTKITNADLRIEFFPTLREVLAASVFYKHFKNPIEEIVGGTGILSFANADGADLIGVEFEGRKTLDVLDDVLKDFTLIGNLTLVKSVVDLGDNKAAATNASRPMTSQSPYVVNISLDYSNESTHTDVRALYNVSGARLSVVGSNGLPDIYEMPRHLLDFTIAQKVAKRFELKLQAQNVLAQPVVFAYRGEPGYREVQLPDGSTKYESLGNNPVTRRYGVGANFTLSASFTY